jgi:hypothetical protein
MNFVPYLMRMLAVEHTRKNTIGDCGKKPSEEHLVLEKPHLYSVEFFPSKRSATEA